MVLRKFMFLWAVHPVFRLIDFVLPKNAAWWAFTTHHLHGDRFIENQRAVFEHVKADPSIKKLIFYRGEQVEFGIEGGSNVVFVRLGTLRSLALLLRCKVVLVTHSIAMDYSMRWGGRGFSVLKLAFGQRVVVNLWHGIPLKRLLMAANADVSSHTDRVKYRREERKQYAGLIASSDVDSYAMAAMFYPLNYRQVWVTGLPRNDFLSSEVVWLPRYIRESIAHVREVKGDRKLLVYAPTYRQVSVSEGAYYYQFSLEEIEALKAVLRSSGFVLGYRPHYFKNSEHYFNLDSFIDGDLIVDLSQPVVPEFSAIVRECDLLVTDYSSVFIDAVYLGKPVVSFAYDLEHYQSQQDGLLYDLRLAFPGPVCTTFSQLLESISNLAGREGSSNEMHTSYARRFFFNHQDANNSQRVCEHIYKQLSK